MEQWRGGLRGLGFFTFPLLFLVAGLSFSGYSGGSDLSFPTESQAVFLDNGQVFFGKLGEVSSEYPTLRDVYYIQRQMEPEKKEARNLLVRLGSEWHAPDFMRINSRHIVSIEPVAPGAPSDEPGLSSGQHHPPVPLLGLGDRGPVAQRPGGGFVCPAPAALGVRGLGGGAKGRAEHLLLAGHHAGLRRLRHGPVLAAGAGLALLAVSAFVVYRARRQPYLLVGWLWYLGTLVPVIGIIQVGGQAMADRYTYVPFIGLFVMLAWGVFAATAAWRRRRVLLSIGAGAALLACLVSTWVQVGYWRNSETLFNYALKIDPTNYMAYHHLGMALYSEGKIDQAIAMYQKTLAVAPQYPSTHNNLAIVYAEQGRYHEAIPLFKAAIRLTPNNISFYHNLALAYQKQGKLAEAEAVQAHIRWLLGERGRAAKPIDLF